MPPWSAQEIPVSSSLLSAAARYEIPIMNIGIQIASPNLRCGSRLSRVSVHGTSSSSHNVRIGWIHAWLLIFPAIAYVNNSTNAANATRGATPKPNDISKMTQTARSHAGPIADIDTTSNEIAKAIRNATSARGVIAGTRAAIHRRPWGVAPRQTMRTKTNTGARPNRRNRTPNGLPAMWSSGGYLRISHSSAVTVSHSSAVRFIRFSRRTCANSGVARIAAIFSWEVSVRTYSKMPFSTSGACIDNRLATASFAGPRHCTMTIA